jgi:MinD-like ATPase involved in chromosome partitioning or flagellar assembly
MNQGPPPPPWGSEPQQQRPPAPPPQQHHPGPPQQRYAEPPMATPGAGSWSYVDQIRPSELVPTRKIPPGRGWRRAVYRGSFKLINPGRSPDERRLAELETKIRSLLRGRYKIGVLGKGGAGKTTVAACVGSIFAELRQDDRVVAIDADIAFGKLGSRVDPNAAGSYWELASDKHLHTFADVRSRVGNNAAGLFVLGGEMATARRRVIDPAIYRAATARLDNHFTLSIIDCGSAMDTAVTQEVLRDLDALIVVTSPWVDGAAAAGQTMDWLAHNGFTGLLHRTVVVINDSDGHVDKRTRAHLAEQFSSRGQVVVQVPFDAHLRPGGVIDVDNELDATTRRRFIEIAAALAEHFPTTTDGPQERR